MLEKLVWPFNALAQWKSGLQQGTFYAVIVDEHLIGVAEMLHLLVPEISFTYEQRHI